MSETGPSITILPDGPYLVAGDVPLSVASMEPLPGGDSWEWRAGATLERAPRYALCRCGESARKPFCDGTHAAIDFDAALTAATVPFAEAAQTIAGPALDLLDATSLCAYARFCDNHGTIWNLIATTEDPHVRHIVEHEATHCPSGRLVVRDSGAQTPVEPAFEPSIVLAQDPAKECSGPLWVRGGIPIAAQGGAMYETRNRVTLCRCGKSANKPFCDGTHVDVAFNDGLT